MATIINNEATADETKLQITDPFIYVTDPNKGKPISGAQLFFGIVGRDPVLADHQKKVYALQEDGSAVSIAQPVLTGAGGVPMYNGSPVALAVSGDYSYKVLDENNVTEYYLPRVKAPNNQGFSGVIAEEAVTVSGGQPASDFVKIEATTASFYVSSDGAGTSFNGRYMRKGVDYIVVSPTQISLVSPYPDGTVIVGREMDPTGQIVPVTEGSTALFVFQLLADAKTADLQVGDTVTINGKDVLGDGLIGGKYITVAPGTGTADDENFIDLNNLNQLQLIPNVHRFKRYIESVSTTAISSGNLNINLEDGGVQEVTLTENISDVLFLNGNDKGAQTVTLKVTQAAGSLYNITWPATTKWSGGTAPVVTQTNNAVDIFVFVSYDGATWHGSVAGQDFS